MQFISDSACLASYLSSKAVFSVISLCIYRLCRCNRSDHTTDQTIPSGYKLA